MEMTMGKKRNKYSADFKAKVALAATLFLYEAKASHIV